MRTTICTVGAVCLVVTLGTSLADSELTFFPEDQRDLRDFGHLGPPVVAFGDVDGDGVDDLFALPHWFKGDGEGNFSATRNTVVLDDSGAFPRLLDYDDDGDLDIFFGATNGVVGDLIGVSLRRNDGGVFTKLTIPEYGLDVNTRSDGVPFDHGDDGDTDFASVLILDTPTSKNVVEIIENDGTDTFTRTVRFDIGLSRGPLRSADMNDDDLDDLIIGGSGFVLVALQRPDGEFDLLEPVTFQPNGNAAPAIVADFAGDDRPDVFTGDALFVNDGTGTLTTEVGTNERPPLLLYDAMVAGDFDNDGDLDVAGSGASGDVTVLWNEDGVFSAASSTELGIATFGVRALATADVDGNGRLDFAVSSRSRAVLTVTRQSGSPPPGTVFVTPGVIQSAGSHQLDVQSSELQTGARVELGESVLVDQVFVEDEERARVDLRVVEGAGGGMRELVIRNPDGQTARGEVEFRSVNLTVKSGKLKATSAPARDVLKLAGVIAPNSLSEHGTFVGRELGLTLSIGRGFEQFELVIPPNDPRWKARKGGRKLTYASGPDEYPRVSLKVDTRRGTFRLRVSHYDQPADVAGAVEVAFDSDTDHGVAEGEWRRKGRSRVLRYR